jgi:hypothetical protein
MILVLVVHFAEIVLPELLAGRPIKPWAVDPTYLQNVGREPMPQAPGDVDDASPGSPESRATVEEQNAKTAPTPGDTSDADRSSETSGPGLSSKSGHPEHSSSGDDPGA